MKKNLLGWGVALAAGAPLLATAQEAKTEPLKTTPQLTYRSAFADYKPYRDATLANWRELNATLAGEPGGTSSHTGHGMGSMKGMEMPGAPAAPASAAMAMKLPMPMHHGHPEKVGTP